MFRVYRYENIQFQILTGVCTAGNKNIMILVSWPLKFTGGRGGGRVEAETDVFERRDKSQIEIQKYSVG